MPERLDRRRKMLSADISRACKMKAQGKTYASIGVAFGNSETAAKYWTNPTWREIVKEKARIARRKRWLSLSPEQKEEDKRKSIEVMMRKRKIQPEYREYADQTHYKYAKTPKASATRRKYYARNSTRLNKLQHVQYRKHRAERLASRKEYVLKNIERIRAQMREYYWKNREKILTKHKERRAHN